MDFIWHDGGRAACGFVGSTGDCVTRCIAIATGEVYRDVYEWLSSISGQTARNGISHTVISKFLAKRGWKSEAGLGNSEGLPKGVLIVQFAPVASRKRKGHLSCIIDHAIYDTWNPMEDPEYQITSIWTREQVATGTTLPGRKPGTSPVTEEARLTQNEYEKILKRVKALDRTASNHASTEGEIRNALRAMQSLMLKHNLSRNDLVEDDDVSETCMTRRACPLNGSKAYQWESFLAHYLTEEIFQTVQFYRARRGHRTLFWFYGPVDDVEQVLGLFRELLLTIATAAHVKYGCHTRGSGASYAEGYVNGLPRTDQIQPHDEVPVSEAALIHTRTLAIHNAAKDWLDEECGIRLQNARSSGRGHFDESAHRDGKRDGARHEHAGQHARKQITHYRDQ